LAATKIERAPATIAVSPVIAIAIALEVTPPVSLEITASIGIVEIAAAIPILSDIRLHATLSRRYLSVVAATATPLLRDIRLRRSLSRRDLCGPIATAATLLRDVGNWRGGNWRGLTRLRADFIRIHATEKPTVSRRRITLRRRRRRRGRSALPRRVLLPFLLAVFALLVSALRRGDDRKR
jgi:hypothetical protein